tara:strand:+ start:166 stop:396 length:231 start_codon:yes stop_codon:yes gene_type:complete
MKFKIGELVKWYELYGDIGIVKDTGLGILLSVRKVNFNKETNYIYKIHTLKTQRAMLLEEYCIEKLDIKGEKNEII